MSDCNDAFGMLKKYGVFVEPEELTLTDTEISVAKQIEESISVIERRISMAEMEKLRALRALEEILDKRGNLMESLSASRGLRDTSFSVDIAEGKIVLDAE